MTSRQERDIAATLFLALALLMAFALYAPSHWTGWLGRNLSAVTRGGFGSLALILPLLLLILSLILYLQRIASVSSRQAGALLIIYLWASSLVSLFVLPLSRLSESLAPMPGRGSAGWHLIAELWRFGRFPEAIRPGNRLSGGLLGGLVSLGLERVAGLTGALIILFALLVTLLVFAFGLSPSRLSSISRGLPADPMGEGADDEAASDTGQQKTAPGGWFSRRRKGEEPSHGTEESPAPSQTPSALTGAGPAGWDTLHTPQAAGESSHEREGLQFPKPPPGYRGAAVESKPRLPLQGVPYLLSPPSHTEPLPVITTAADLPLPAAELPSMRTPELALAKEARRKEVRRYRPEQMSVLSEYRPPPLTLLKADSGMKKTPQEIKEIRELGRKLEETLDNFGVDAQIINYTSGPTITRFELSPGPGIKVSKIVNLTDDIALSLAAMGVRIEAPIPGKAAIGIEIPNKKMSPVLLRSLLESAEYKSEKGPLVAAIGRDVAGQAIMCDLARMPHLLIAGATGSGKSVCINAILVSILYRSSPKEVRMLMIDPKIVELNVYNGIPHLLQPVVTNPEKAYGVLNYAVSEMERRYRLFADRKVRDIASYNESVSRAKKTEDSEETIPHILIVIDELADLMAITQHQVESAISRLMAKARAVGIHVIIATQRPSVDVITGVIKANIPSRIAFAVASQVDSRTIIDSGGAEKLLGRGDMLYYPLGSIKAIRGQGAFVSNGEVERILSFIKSYYPEDYDERVAVAIENPDGEDQAMMSGSGEDELLMEALRVIIEADYAAVSLLQRKLQVGYPRAARLVDRLSELGYVGPFEGSKPRKVMITRDQYDRLAADTDLAGGDDHFD